MSDMIHAKQDILFKSSKTMIKGCILRGKRKDNGDTATVSFTIEDAKKAKLLNKDNYSIWAAGHVFLPMHG